MPLAGISAGLRVYAGTPLDRAIADGSVEGRLSPAAGEAGELRFYASPHLPADISAFVNACVAGDSRFLVLAAPGEQNSYNYADDNSLSQAIRAGARGAYWDIIARSRSGSSMA